MVEQFPLKEKVDGSNPSGLTILNVKVYRSTLQKSKLRLPLSYRPENFAYKSLVAAFNLTRIVSKKCRVPLIWTVSLTS